VKTNSKSLETQKHCGCSLKFFRVHPMAAWIIFRPSIRTHSMKFFSSVIRTRRCAALAFAGSLALTWGAAHAATLVVTNGAPNGPGTLRTLLPTARNGDVITFAVTGIITNQVTGGLTISNNISILGPGSNLLTITGTNRFSAFQAINGSTSSISGLTFYRCTGAIINSANLTVSNCIFTGCYRGGGIVNSSNLLLKNCTFTDCRGTYGTSWNFSGGPTGSAGGSGNDGGAIVNSGNLSGLNCQFQDNFAGVGGDGATGVVDPVFWGLGIYFTTFGGPGGNGGSGGAVYNTDTIRFTNCVFSGNNSGSGGSGGLGGSGGSTTSPAPPHLSSGSGKSGGNAGNAGHGSAIFSSGSATLVSCTFYGNTTGVGGNGGSGGDAYPLGNALSGGKAGNAGNAGSGTLYCTGACQIVACTFYNNTASSGGNGGNGGTGGTFGAGGSGANAGSGGSGGAIYGPRTSGTNFTLQNVLIANDARGYAGSPGYAGANGSSYSGTSPTNGLGSVDGTGPDVSGFFTSRTHNFISLRDGSTGFTNSVRSDIVGSGSALNALVADLADNHGFVPTCALLTNSPCVNAGDDTLLASNIVTDARGFPRKAGAHVDIGAYELQYLSLPVRCKMSVAADGAQLAVTNAPGMTFTVYGTFDLTLPTANWDYLGQMTEPTPGFYQWTDASYTDYEARFFQISSP
jgi:hypothetical protein